MSSEKKLEAKIKTHDMRMKELQYIRETEKLKHEWEKERMRIKSAEIRRHAEYMSRNKR